MRDVGEGTAVHEGRIVLDRLHQVGLQGVAQQRGHCAVRIEFAHGHRLVGAGVTEHDPREPCLEVSKVRRQAENRHDFGCDRDVESGFAHHAVLVSAEAGGNRTQRAIVHVDYAPPGNPARIDAEFVVPVQVIVDECRKQVVCGADRMEVAGEMQVDIRHRDDLRVAAARRAALHAEARAEARLTQADRRLAANAVEAVAEADGRRRLALAGRGRRYGGNQDELAVARMAVGTNEIVRDLRLVAAIGNQDVRWNTELEADRLDRFERRGLRNLNIASDSCHIPPPLRPPVRTSSAILTEIRFRAQPRCDAAFRRRN